MKVWVTSSYVSLKKCQPCVMYYLLPVGFHVVCIMTDPYCRLQNTVTFRISFGVTVFPWSNNKKCNVITMATTRRGKFIQRTECWAEKCIRSPAVLWSGIRVYIWCSSVSWPGSKSLLPAKCPTKCQLSDCCSIFSEHESSTVSLIVSVTARYDGAQYSMNRF